MRAVSSGAEARQASSPAGFSTTRWSLIISGAKLDTGERAAQKAFAELCHTYWRPIFFFACRRGFPIEEAQDLTQDFFTMMLRENWLQHADRTRGRFRSLLLRSLERFLHDARDKARAQRRGGGVQFIAWDDWMAEAPSHLMVSQRTLEQLRPEQLFDVRWAATVVEQALRQLANECEAKGRRRLFEMLSPYLSMDRAETSYAHLAAQLGVPATAVKRQLHNLRLRYRWLLRKEVARTVADPAEVDEEIRYLCSALAAGSQ
jgi:DNA-directed RNA polymerase specialized sigma24 family protein